MIISTWDRTAPQFYFGERIVMTPAAFSALPVITGTPEALHQYYPYTQLRALIALGARTCWHIVEQQFICGHPVYFAHPIVIRAYRAEVE